MSDSSYERRFREFEWHVPAQFNFGGDVVDRWAREQPDTLALMWADDHGNERLLTYRDVSLQSNRVANLLQQAGVKRGDRVVIMLPRLPEWQLSLVACIKLGAIPIPCITMLTEADIAYRVEHSGATAAITNVASVDKFKAQPASFRRFVVGGAVEGWRNLADADALSVDFAPVAMDADEPAIIYYTSGSTGSPKGVTHGARSLYAWRQSAVEWLALKPGDRMWCTADTGWSKAGTSILFGPWSQGASVLFYDGPFDPRQRFVLLEKYRINCFCAAATEFRRLVREDVSGFDLSALKLTVSAGESVNPEIVHKWRALANTEMLDGYGQTETLMTVLNYPDMPVKPGSMGRPMPGIHGGILTDDGRIAERSAEGQFVVKLPNPSIMLGYWRDEARTKASRIVIDGETWFQTGDNMTADADGYLFYQGRNDDIISSSGYRIGPQEVENALIKHPAVQESAVIGRPDPERGEIVEAHIVLAAGYTPSPALVNELQDHVKQQTAPYKYPRRIIFAETLPKTVSGKIQRAVLRKMPVDG